MMCWQTQSSISCFGWRERATAFHGTPQFHGLLLVVGFVALLILLVLSH